MEKIRWGGALVNGLLAWFLGFVLYMIPSLVKGAQMGFSMGPQMQDPAAFSQQISEEIAAMYASSWWLTGALIVITALLVLWRAWAVAKGSGSKRLANGLVVGAVPAVLSLLFLACGGFGLVDVVVILVYLGAGAAGGQLAEV